MVRQQARLTRRFRDGYLETIAAVRQLADDMRGLGEIARHVLEVLRRAEDEMEFSESNKKDDGGRGDA